MIPRRCRPIGVVPLLVLCLAAPTLAQQQGDLPADVVTSTNVNSGQQQAIDRFVRGWADQMARQDANDDQIAEARGKLIDPFLRPTASDAFKTAYSAALTAQLARLVGLS